MAKKQFKAESKRLLDIMINSIYTHKEIFLRELISNASDALDKRHYFLLTDKKKKYSRDDLYIRITADKKNRTLTITDTGIGMDKKELEENLGTIAKSGTLAFKLENKIKDSNDIIGQFGVGFYSAFMVASKVVVISKKNETDKAYKWESSGIDGYAISEVKKDNIGTDIILTIKENEKEEKYDDFLEEYHLRWLIKKYSDFIKHPIIMKTTKSRPKKDNKDEFEEYQEDETINSMIPIWRKKKKELKEEDYENFYLEQKFGYDKPLKVIHTSAEGVVSYDVLLYIPTELPFDFFTKDFQKGLKLYVNNVLITEKCAELLPDYFGFVRGLVDSPDVSLNISREMLQHDRQLQFIAKRINDKIKKELSEMLKNEREKYETFFKNFGRVIKYGVYTDWGVNKEFLQDLIMFYSSREKKLVTLDEYVSRMKKKQKYIYYATGEDVDMIDKLPQTEFAKEKDYEILYLTDEIDEFAVKMLSQYQDKEFKSVSSSELEESKKTTADKQTKEIFAFMKEVLKDKIKDIRASERLRSYPVCIINEGAVSIEMEKVLKMMPNAQDVKTDKILEINTEHEIFNTIKKAFKNDKEKLKTITKILYNQSLLIEGLSVDDPVGFSNDIYSLIKQ
ncbi:MAG: molecular chaperone HtpG [Bacilli bacterium]|jgi:molecular chaperone HtpG